MQKKWAVIGGGPCGIGAVGKLIDAGQQVIWIDPNFENIGRMGKYYRGVPANTPNGSLWNALTSCQSFEIEKYCALKVKNNESTLHDLNPSECSQLGVLVDVLEHASYTLQSNPLVTVVKGTVTSMILKETWSLFISLPDDIYTIQSKADFVLLAHGASPVFPPNILSTSPHHKVDHMVNPIAVQKHFSLHPELLSQPWAVVGSSHRWFLILISSEHFSVPCL
jgi:pyruvate/2-oxoglutarate dehydrogenase complex dihydrolipoamide dehydrogenase (E3) component